MDIQRPKVVLVDDNESTLDQGKSLLQAHYRVLTFTSAALLFEYLENDLPDLILLDVEMPEMDGFEAIKILKKNPRYSEIPVMFLTAKSDEESERNGFRLGAVDYVAKPFSAPLLQKRISNQILYMRVQSAVHDYSENLEKIMDEATKANERAEIAEMTSVAKSQFLAMMSHELRTPMNSITGFAELALNYEEASIPPKVKEYLSKILDSAKWFLRIANDILDISKIESGKMEIENIPFDLKDIIYRCQSIIAAEAKQKNLEYKVYMESMPEINIISDSMRLYQVLINLLVNAVKFTNSGSVKLTVLPKEQKDNTISVYFEIKDTGIGMDENQLKKLFQPFTQGDSSTTRKYGGTGLGLAITKNIIELMGGTLSVESYPNKGTTFSFEIKFNTITALGGMTKLPEEHGEKPVFEGEVLICDDNLMNQEVISEHLTQVGLKTFIAANGNEAVEIIKERIDNGKTPFNLIFMDIYMPVMDGIEAAAKIIELGCKTPIIAMTANIMTSEIQKYKESGMPDCLTKPFTTGELWNLLLKFLKPVKKSQ